MDRVKIPIVSTGTSPFIGAGQFGINAFIWRKKFLNNPKAMFEILEASYQVGARGIEAIPIGKIMDAARMMVETYKDYVIMGSTYPGSNTGIETLLDSGAKLIFVHGIISDERNHNLHNLLDEISSHGVISGVATHEPIPTINYVIENSLNVNAFLIPFNKAGRFMGNAKKLVRIVNESKQFYFIGMKTLAAGSIEPKSAFKFISKHNICAVTVGMTNIIEAQSSTRIALEYLNNREKIKK